ncbi:chitosanase [Catenulispora rubra]|uniref:chitosanase n=1 Tax=Catenulispora rubra TaxID=280293 RepID=UPI0018921576|nr:chitosanase [Catenulispora rubra]
MRVPSAVPMVLVAALIAATLTACGGSSGDSADPAPAPATASSTASSSAPATSASASASATPSAASALTTDQRRRADQLISVFENSTPDIQYAYAENIGDGRGVTAGRAGFTTNDGDALKVIQAYAARVPQNKLAHYIPELQRLADAGSSDTSGLPEASYVADWKAAGTDPAFQQVQDDQVNQRYFAPAASAADQLGLTTALARAELYDASIQHGNGTEYDALPSLIARTTAKVGAPGKAGRATEQAWLNAFFDVRIDDLRHPANAATQNEWSQSVDRVECLRRIAASGNYQLSGPLKVTAFGTDYTLK